MHCVIRYAKVCAAIFIGIDQLTLNRPIKLIGVSGTQRHREWTARLSNRIEVIMSTKMRERKEVEFRERRLISLSFFLSRYIGNTN